MPKFATVEEYFASLPEPLRPIADLLLPIVDGELPGAGAVWHGHATWSLGDAPVNHRLPGQGLPDVPDLLLLGGTGETIYPVAWKPGRSRWPA